MISGTRIGKARSAACASLATLVVLLAGCGGGNDPGRFAFDLVLTGLPDGTNDPGHYEGWAIIDGNALTTGKFRVLGTGPDAEVRLLLNDEILGTAASARFGPSATMLGGDFPLLESATHFFVTREPEGDIDRIPSCDVLLAGAVNGSTGAFTAEGVLVPEGFPCSVPVGGGMARLGVGDFSAAAGTFQLRTPTDDLSNATPNDFAGVWFVADDGAGGVQAGLTLPELSEGSIYEGWAVVDGVVRSTGRFRDAQARDLDFGTAPQRGDDGPGPNFPGQDFVNDVMPAFAFDPPVLDLVGDMITMDGDTRFSVTVEPLFDNARGPFPIEVLALTIPPTAVDENGFGTTVDLETSTLPTADVALGSSAITLTELGLSDLGAANGRRGHYELWIDDGTTVTSIAKFVIDGETVQRLDGAQTFGTRMSATFDAATTGLAAFPDATLAISCFITFENEADADAVPGLVLLEGANEAGMASLDTLGDFLAGGRGLSDFSIAAGAISLGTPTDDVADNGDFGVVLVGSNVDPVATLPPLPEGFVYEGFIEDFATGRSFSTGRFRLASGLDFNDQISQSRGPLLKPLRPGEDFLFDVPTETLNAAQAASITEVFVTIESDPPSQLGPVGPRVFEALVPASAVTGGVGGVDVPMTNVFGTGAPTGSLTIISLD